MTISHSTISGNGADIGDGGGIYNNSGTVTISHSTISGNSAMAAVSTTTTTVTISRHDFRNAHIWRRYLQQWHGDGRKLQQHHREQCAFRFGPDVYNLGTLYLDGTSTSGVLVGNSAIGLNPALNIHSWSSTAHQLVLSWSTNYTGCTLQSSTDPGSTNWTDCASPAVSGASFVVTNSMSAGAQFFRLKR